MNYKAVIASISKQSTEIEQIDALPAVARNDTHK